MMELTNHVVMEPGKKRRRRAKSEVMFRAFSPLPYWGF
jgi:hypothetical protein